MGGRALRRHCLAVEMGRREPEWSDWETVWRRLGEDFCGSEAEVVICIVLRRVNGASDARQRRSFFFFFLFSHRINLERLQKLKLSKKFISVTSILFCIPAKMVRNVSFLFSCCPYDL